MKKIWWLVFLWLLIGCGGKTEAIALSPTPRDIASPTELPEQLTRLPIYWQGRIITLGGVPVLDSPIVTSGEDKSLPCYAFSHDHRYFAYCYDEWLPEEPGAFPGFPGVREKIGLWDLKHNKRQELFEANPFGANPTIRGGVAFSPDDKKVLFAVAWQNEKGTDRVDLASVDILSGKIEYLGIDSLYSLPFELDISPDGKWAAMDVSTLDDQVCLLIEMGERRLKCLMLEKGHYISPKFINNQSLIYVHRLNKEVGIFVLRIDNGEKKKQPVSGLNRARIIAGTDNFIIFSGATYENYKCESIYAIKLDGSDFRRLSYLGEECLTEDALSR